MKKTLLLWQILLQSIVQCSYLKWVFMKTMKKCNSDGFKCLVPIDLYINTYCLHIHTACRQCTCRNAASNHPCCVYSIHATQEKNVFSRLQIAFTFIHFIGNCMLSIIIVPIINNFKLKALRLQAWEDELQTIRIRMSW